MKICLTLASALFIAVFAAYAETAPHSSFVVGYKQLELKIGWNEIKVNFDVAGPFPVFTTLDKVIKFFPAEAIVGDEIVYDLDGYHQKYSITSYDKASDKYTLVKTQTKGDYPDKISFDWIPIPKIFWVNHKTTNIVHLSQAGLVDNDYRMSIDSEYSSTSKKNPALIEVIPVDPKDSLNLYYTLKGGKIMQKP